MERNNMKILVIACVVSLIASIGATMYLTGTFKRNVPDDTGQPIEEKDAEIKNQQLKNQNLTSNVSVKSNSKNPSINKETSLAKLELEKIKAQIAEESAKLASIRTEIQALNNAKEQANKYKQMAIMYSAMKPNEAASVICELDEDIAKNILLEMDSKIAGKIMNAIAATNPKYAANISKLIIKTEANSKFSNSFQDNTKSNLVF